MFRYLNKCINIGNAMTFKLHDPSKKAGVRWSFDRAAQICLYRNNRIDIWSRNSNTVEYTDAFDKMIPKFLAASSKRELVF